MHWYLPQRFLLVTGALILAGFVLFLSLWQLNLSVQGVKDSESSELAAADRVKEWFTPPILPDHPLYVFGTIYDRLEIIFSPPDKRFALKLVDADTRLATAQVLVARGRKNMAITCLTKGEKYIISAAEEIPNLPVTSQKNARGQLLNNILTHKAALITMKPLFTGPQQATIDSLIEQILVLAPNR